MRQPRNTQGNQFPFKVVFLHGCSLTVEAWNDEAPGVVRQGPGVIRQGPAQVPSLLNCCLRICWRDEPICLAMSPSLMQRHYREWAQYIPLKGGLWAFLQVSLRLLHCCPIWFLSIEKYPYVPGVSGTSWDSVWSLSVQWSEYSNLTSFHNHHSETQFLFPNPNFALSLTHIWTPFSDMM